MPEYSDFYNELHRMMMEAVRRGQHSIEVSAGDLHRRVGDYPDANRHRMPVCCAVMRDVLAPDAGDVILFEPSKGQGATLTIRYVLPRQEPDPIPFD